MLVDEENRKLKMSGDKPVIAAVVSRPIFGWMVTDKCQNGFYKRGVNGQNSRRTGEKILNLKIEMGRLIKRSCSAGTGGTTAQTRLAIVKVS